MSINACEFHVHQCRLIPWASIPVNSMSINVREFHAHQCLWIPCASIPVHSMRININKFHAHQCLQMPKCSTQPSYQWIFLLQYTSQSRVFSIHSHLYKNVDVDTFYSTVHVSIHGNTWRSTFFRSEVGKVTLKNEKQDFDRRWLFRDCFG